MSKLNLTPYQRHCNRWKDGCGNTICEGASHVVLGKGRLPCDILFIGEAPGESEDAIGQPFVGPAGHLLDRIIGEVLTGKTWGPSPSDFRLAFTNLVGCIPRDGDGKKAGEPDYAEVLKCSNRLREFVALAKPKLVVYVGGLAKKHGPSAVPEGTKAIDIVHPAAILRANVAQQGLMVQRCMAQLANAVEEL